MTMITVIKPRRPQPQPPGGILRRSHRVGPYTITWTFDLDAFQPGAVGQTNVDWQPDLPPKGWLTKPRLARYQDGRNAIYQEVADITGGNLMVVDL